MKNNKHQNVTCKVNKLCRMAGALFSYPTGKNGSSSDRKYHLYVIGFVL